MRRFLRVDALFIGVGCACLAVQPSLAQEQSSRFDIGVRGVILLGKGEPANDMTGVGLMGRWRFREGWYAGVALDRVKFDYETPERVLGITAATVVDGSNELSRTSLLLDRVYDSDGRWDWYWRIGVGFASVDVPNVSGATLSGGTYDIATVADDEVHIMAGGGLRRPIGQHWILESTLTFEHHDTDYRLTDRISGASGAMGSHSPYGIAVGISYGF
jgi:hypothetical protein